MFRIRKKTRGRNSYYTGDDPMFSSFSSSFAYNEEKYANSERRRIEEETGLELVVVRVDDRGNNL